MENKVVELNPHERMTPEEALAKCSREEWDKIVIVGFHHGNNELIVRSSHISRETALWIIEHTRMHVLGLK